ncbi:MAG: hypothetical protein MUE83_16060 [Tabrizicola sp.]|jgi:hypothetical protein|nr:hypothetical protein [Tabrizicola sp.]
MRGVATPVLACLVTLSAAVATLAQTADKDPPMTAEAFERFVQGRTMDTHDQTGRYGVETFLPGRRAIWRDAEQCLEGTWRPEGDQICFDYDGDPFQYCWTYHDRGDWLMAWLDGDRSSQPIMLYPADEVVTCEGYFGV